jgi:predicted transposase YdaD
MMEPLFEIANSLVSMLSPNPHDTFIKRIFANKEDAVAFFRATLPPEVQAILDLEQLEQTKESFLPKNQNLTQTDILWKIPTKSGTSIYTYLLFEHKSYHDPKIYFQLLGYLTQIYLWQKENGQELTPVIPFVFYHGERIWDLGLNFVDQFHPFYRELLKELSQVETEAKKVEILEKLLYYLLSVRPRDENEFRNEEIYRMEGLEGVFMTLLEEIKLEGKLEAAEKMLNENIDLSVVLRVTGLNESDLRDRGLIK